MKTACGLGVCLWLGAELLCSAPAGPPPLSNPSSSEPHRWAPWPFIRGMTAEISSGITMGSENNNNKISLGEGSQLSSINGSLIKYSSPRAPELDRYGCSSQRGWLCYYKRWSRQALCCFMSCYSPSFCGGARSQWESVMRSTGLLIQQPQEAAPGLGERPLREQEMVGMLPAMNTTSRKRGDGGAPCKRSGCYFVLKSPSLGISAFLGAECGRATAEGEEQVVKSWEKILTLQKSSCLFPAVSIRILTLQCASLKIHLQKPEGWKSSGRWPQELRPSAP